MSGELPKGWAEATLGDIADYVQRGKSPKYAPMSALPVINQKCVRWWGIDRNHLKYISEEQWSSWDQDRYIRNGDILWNSTGTGTIGRAALYESSELTEKIVCDSHVTILRMNDEISKKYVYWHIRSPSVQNKIESMQSGSTNQVELGKGEILSTPIPLAPKREQAHIVEKIDALFERSRAAREELARIPKLIERYRQAVLEAAFRGDLTANWRILNSERVKILGEKNTDTSPYAIPDSWIWVPLPKLGFLGRGKSRHRPRNDSSLFGGAYPFVQTGDVRAADGVLKNFRQTYNDKGLAQSRIWPSGTVCITIAANIAESAVLGIDACFPDSVVGFTANKEICRPFFMEFFMRTIRGDLEAFAPATAQKNINLDTLNEVIVPVPPVSEQDEIIRRISRTFASISALELEREKAESLTQRLDQAILDKAFRGELVAQDPNDEPASVLLERIRAVRAAAPAPRRGQRAKPAE